MKNFILLLLFITLISCQDNRVLIIDITETSSSYDSKLFTKALKEGGQISIPTDEIPGLEEFALIGNDGTYFIQGAVINYVLSKGWEFHSVSVSGIYFTKK